MNDVYILWIIFSLFVGVSLAIDLGVFSRLRPKKQESPNKAHAPTIRAALIWTIVWISLAGIFAGIIYVDMGNQKLTEFVTGYAL